MGLSSRSRRGDGGQQDAPAASTSRWTIRPSAGARERSRTVSGSEASASASALIGGRGSRGGANASARSQQTDATSASTPVIGYYNSFHTHSKPAPAAPRLPTYADAARRWENTSLHVCRRPEEGIQEALPPYSCSLFLAGPLALKHELSNPFTVAYDRSWRDVYVVVCGTQISIHRLKSTTLLGKAFDAPQAGRLIRTYSLQHAEVGVAQDFKKTGPIPRSTRAKLATAATRQKLYESDSAMFDPPREHVLRVRAEGEQFILCCPSMEVLLGWVEVLCMAVDISMPLDDRSEPRYRTLPRRSRRANRNVVVDVHAPQGSEMGRRLLDEQNRIMRALYPRLARDASIEEHSPAPAHNHDDQITTQQSPSAEDDMQQPSEITSAEYDLQLSQRTTQSEIEDEEDPPPQLPEAVGGEALRRAMQSDPDAEDLEHPDTFLTDAYPTASRPLCGSNGASEPRDPTGPRPLNSQAESFGSTSNGKPTSSRVPTDPLRLRRRFAPNLHANSPRASDVVLIGGKRWKVVTDTQSLLPWHAKPPRYSEHGFDIGSRQAALRRQLPAPIIPNSESTFVASFTAPVGVLRERRSSTQMRDVDEAPHDGAAETFAASQLSTTPPRNGTEVGLPAQPMLALSSDGIGDEDDFLLTDFASGPSISSMLSFASGRSSSSVELSTAPDSISSTARLSTNTVAARLPAPPQRKAPDPPKAAIHGRGSKIAGPTHLSRPREAEVVGLVGAL